MSTLSNVSTHQGETESLTRAGATPCAPPGKHAEGVSVENVLEPKCWYVLRVHYGRIREVMEMLETDGVEYYVPQHKIYKTIDGKMTLVKEPLLPNLIFVHASAISVDVIVKNYVHRNKITSKYVSYYYDHFTKDDNGHNPPLTIPDHEMQNFITLTSIDNDHIILVNHEQCHFKSGDIVRVTDGQFKGITGRVARVVGQQRVIIELSNLCLIASAYIPSAFLEIYENS